MTVNTSAGEDVFLNAKSSGGIALFTTVRVAYSRPNYPDTDRQLLSVILFERNNGRQSYAWEK